MERFPQRGKVRCCVVFHTPRLRNIWWYNLSMSTPPENNPPSNDPRSSEETEELLPIIQRALGLVAQGLSVNTDSLKQVADFIDEQRELNSKVSDFMGEVNTKLDGIRNDLGEVRGGHARNAVQGNAALVAEALNCRLISEVPKGILLGFARMAAANGEPSSDVESFRNADLVLYVTDAQDRPRYLAVEASFTVADRDISRAARNAGYLQKYTGLPSDPVVAGVEVLQAAQGRIDQGEAQLYRIQRRELQPE